MVGRCKNLISHTILIYSLFNIAKYLRHKMAPSWDHSMLMICYIFNSSLSSISAQWRSSSIFLIFIIYIFNYFIFDSRYSNNSFLQATIYVGYYYHCCYFPVNRPVISLSSFSNLLILYFRDRSTLVFLTSLQSSTGSGYSKNKGMMLICKTMNILDFNVIVGCFMRTLLRKCRK